MLLYLKIFALLEVKHLPIVQTSTEWWVVWVRRFGGGCGCRGGGGGGRGGGGVFGVSHLQTPQDPEDA